LIILIIYYEKQWMRVERVAWGLISLFSEEMLEKNKYFIAILN
jgi:uncharacterized protein YqgQ